MNSITPSFRSWISPLTPSWISGKGQQDPILEEFKRDLTQWSDESNIDRQQSANRKTAVKEILDCYSKKTDYLCLKNLQLTNLPNLSRLEWLKQLDLSNNKLTSFDDQNFQSLRWLNLSHNNIGSFNGKGKNLSQLQRLDLSYNDLNSFDGQDFRELEDLKLSDNHITSFTNSKDLKKLASLSISWNKLTSFDCQDLKGLEDLDLSHNNIGSFNSKGKNLSQLRTLNLSYNDLNSFDGQDFRELEDLKLSNNHIISFTNSKDLKKLASLSISWNKLTSLDCQDLMLLRVLRAENNEIASLNSKNLKSLEELYLSSNKLASLDCQDLVRAKVLRLSYNELSSLNNCQNLEELKELDLSINKFISLEEIEQLPLVSNTLRKIILDFNPFKQRESQRIALRVHPGEIQDFNEKTLEKLGVEIVPLFKDSYSSEERRSIFSRLLKEEDLSSYQILLDDPINASSLAVFLERMMCVSPRYDDSLRSFLTLARDNADFRQNLFTSAFYASSKPRCASHGNNIFTNTLFYRFNELSGLRAIYQRKRESKTFASTLISLQYLQLIHQEARKIFKKWASEPLPPAVSFYLQLELKEKLNLPIEIKEMVRKDLTEEFIRCCLLQSRGKITVQEWVDEIAGICLSASSDEEKKLDLLAKSALDKKLFENHAFVLALRKKFAGALKLFLPKINVKRENTETPVSDEALLLANAAFDENATTPLSLPDLERAISEASVNRALTGCKNLAKREQKDLHALIKEHIRANGLPIS